MQTKEPTQETQFKVLKFSDEFRDSVKQKLDSQGFVVVTRAKEPNFEYEKGKTYQTDWGQNVKIKRIEKYKKIEDHPFLPELTKDEVIHFAQFEVIFVLRLEKAEE